MDIVDNFNYTLESFINFMIEISDDNDIIIYKKMILKILETEKEKAIEQYIINAIPYSKQINDHDENYFINMEFNDNEKYSVLKVLKFKDKFKTLNPENKERIWEYLQVFLHYANEYYVKKYKI